MATTITFSLPSDEETKSIIENQVENKYLLYPAKTVFKPFPSTIKKKIETDRRQRRIPISKSTSDFLTVKQAAIDIPDNDLDDNTQTRRTRLISHESRNHSIVSSRRNRSPSEVRVNLYANENIDIHENLSHSQLVISDSKYKNEIDTSNLSLIDRKYSKQTRIDLIRRTLLEHRLARRIHSSYSSLTALRPLSQRRSIQNLYWRNRRNLYHLSRNSKWHIVRQRLHEIAMMSESYARKKLIEQDFRWINLREKIRIQVLDMREMSFLRQQDDGLIIKKKSDKTRIDLKNIPINEVVHVERDGRVYSMSTRDLVLGRLLCDEAIQLDTFSQLDARRQFQIQQRLLKQQEGRTRLKKHIAFSFCLCNLSFIVLMFAAMLIFATKTIFEMR
ncbi:unnamed protein product [Rotaria sp. Silwood2]|nr:unnamed protein product [Rotaria sp. Silwood2]CAF2771790.1 unnamed protein product [Rotaria sp. Silwood2]CAF2947167.1 unnamed protein product [Rotaria sp. Silwood2]CAF3933738.1 unnamed protein product [Rotaria sp. Silwood2]CAF4086314.1 unnamed protein product [Rotaria sp. Silwood2]